MISIIFVPNLKPTKPLQGLWRVAKISRIWSKYLHPNRDKWLSSRGKMYFQMRENWQVCFSFWCLGHLLGCFYKKIDLLFHLSRYLAILTGLISIYYSVIVTINKHMCKIYYSIFPFETFANQTNWNYSFHNFHIQIQQ